MGGDFPAKFINIQLRKRETNNWGKVAFLTFLNTVVELVQSLKSAELTFWTMFDCKTKPENK